MHVLVVAGPRLTADTRLLEEVAAGEMAALGVSGRFAAVTDVDAFRAELDGAGGDQAVVALPGPDLDARRLIGTPPACAARTVWLDLARVGPLPAAGGAAHHQGRGVLGLVWAIRHAVHRTRRPARRVPYGGHADQWGELRLPAAGDGTPPPVAVLVHGGYWRSIWEADLMDALAIDLADRGYASWNLEYRRPDLYGWDATTGDLATGLAALETVDVPLDLDRIAVIGHSAGGQLALRLAADKERVVADTPRAGTGMRRVALAVSLAGVLDLVEGDRRHLGSGAVAAALGGTADRIPEVYAASSPMERLPLGVPQLIVQGASDDLDLLDIGRRYARAAGDEATYLEAPGDHFAVIDPSSPIWKSTAEELAIRLDLHRPQ
ncbi:alpha/beta hydrolase family protein [Sphaerisporangium perillae]|uniref:alpha/beta hydrolase family protein n=1 Tax=Sphaerisporangium perillae TaxID=2935860 RepID=UPI00200FBD7D|nr:alpha/beta hydrolase [Sphaerisporangium perillae]